jgi:pimeloyl-ACP methyl ester carboxylesterase
VNRIGAAVAVLATSVVALMTGMLLVGQPPMAEWPPEPQRTDRWTGRRQTATISFTTADSIELAGELYVASSRGTVLVLHGLGTHASMAASTAEAIFASSGFRVLAFDLRGNGGSSGPRGRVDRHQRYREDISAIVRWIKRRNPSGPILLAGVRQGGGIGIDYMGSPENSASRSQVQGVLLLDPILTLDSLILAGTDDSAQVEWHRSRLKAIAALDALGIHAFDRLAIGYQTLRLHDGLVVRALRYGAVRALLPPAPVARVRAYPGPLLLVTRSRLADLGSTDEREIVVSAGNVLEDPATWKAVERWTAQFSAAAELPPPISPTIPLPVRDAIGGAPRR